VREGCQSCLFGLPTCSSCSSRQDAVGRLLQLELVSGLGLAGEEQGGVQLLLEMGEGVRLETDLRKCGEV